jgi:hypothetical protein
MRDYQSIPNASINRDEDGVTSGPADKSRSCNTSSSSSPWLMSSLTHSTSKLGFLTIGVIAGFIGSGCLSRRIIVAGIDNNERPVGASSILQLSSNIQQQNYIVNDKSFYDSLPFEEVIPIVKQVHHEQIKIESLVDDAASSSKLVIDETKIDILGVSSSSSPPPTPHILYHATQTAFGLLYDSTKSANGYLSEYSLDYFLLNSGGFDAQINQAYCGVASVAATLNSLKYAKRFREGTDLSGWSFDLPIDPVYDPYPYATQHDVLVNECVWDNVIEHGDSGSGNNKGGGRLHGGTMDGILKPPYGLSLEQASKLLDCHTSKEWAVTVQHVNPSSELTLQKMRYELKAALIDPDARVIINYDRKGFGQVGGGHFSPLGAYHVSTDSFLVVDVAKYKYPPVWVGADTLYSAMATIDRCGTYDYPQGQKRLEDDNDTTSDEDAATGKLINPLSEEDYDSALQVLNCKEMMRGYIILKKKSSSSS